MQTRYICNRCFSKFPNKDIAGIFPLVLFDGMNTCEICGSKNNMKMLEDNSGLDEYIKSVAQNPAKKYKYFISYCFHNGSATGFGNSVIALDYQIKDLQDIRETESFLKEKVRSNGNFSRNYIVAFNIMGWQLLSQEEE